MKLLGCFPVSQDIQGQAGWWLGWETLKKNPSTAGNGTDDSADGTLTLTQRHRMLMGHWAGGKSEISWKHSLTAWSTRDTSRSGWVGWSPWAPTSRGGQRAVLLLGCCFFFLLFCYLGGVGGERERNGIFPTMVSKMARATPVCNPS